MVLLTMLVIPTLIALGFFVFSKKRITLVEFGIQMVVQVCLMAGVASMQSCQNTRDYETWNGRVSSKARERVSCSHSYQCNCYTYCSGSGKSRSCHRRCSTCYEHSYDISWAVYTTLDERLTISRIDRQGLGEPPRWSSVKIGEPTSTVHSYENYVKASPDSLFRHQGLVEKYKGKLPEYPQEIYDYYRLNRVVAVGSIPNVTLKAWNEALSEINADLGKKKQSNIVLVLVQGLPSDYFQALQQHWIGSKKNDIAIVVGLDGNKIAWSDVMAWTQDKMVEVTARDGVVALGEITDANMVNVMSAIKYNVDVYYKRKPMKDFEYLAATVTPTFGQWLFAMIFGTLVSIGISLFMYHNEFTDDSNRPYRRF